LACRRIDKHSWPDALSKRLAAVEGASLSLS
jgi:hypothetical protein